VSTVTHILVDASQDESKLVADRTERRGMQLAKDTCERQRGEHAGLVHEAVYGGTFT